jgi:glycosyltransferase involved in cell wall biosynthesis
MTRLGSTNRFPRITIVMPSFNQVAYLEEAICSVLDQHYPDLEFMILDGGSTDGSRDVIKRYVPYLAYCYSRPDKGQSAAIDDGMSRATGVLAGWLNSDDVLLPGALQCVADAYHLKPDGGLFGGNLVFIDQSGIITGFLRMPSNAAWFAQHGLFTVSQPGSFYRVCDYHAVGGIRRDLHYVMDNELYIRMMLERVRFVYIDRYLAAFRRHAEQKNTARKDRVKAEVKGLDAILQTQGLSYGSTRYLLLYYLWQTINGNYFKKRFHTYAAQGKPWREWARHIYGEYLIGVPK